MPHTEAPPHIPRDYIASLTDADRAEFRKMFASVSEADREEMRKGDVEEWEAFCELHWQLVDFDEAEEDRAAVSQRDQVALFARRRCRPLSAIFENDEEYTRQSVLDMATTMAALEEAVASPVVPGTPANLKDPRPFPLSSHPPVVTEADSVSICSIPSVPVSNDEDFGTGSVGVAKKMQGRLNRFAARAKSYMKRDKC